jgi:hypothetical protein
MLGAPLATLEASRRKVALSATTLSVGSEGAYDAMDRARPSNNVGNVARVTGADRPSFSKTVEVVFDAGGAAHERSA